MASISYVKTRNKWRIRWRATNRATHRVFAGSRVFIEKSQAYRFFAEIEAQEKLWRDGLVETLDSVHSVAAEFESYCRRHTPRTQEHYRSVMRRFLASLPATVARIQQLEAAHIEEYLYRVRDAGGIARTQNAHLTAIKAFCTYYADRLNLPNPARRIKMQTEDPPDSRVISDAEYRLLLEHAAPLAADRIAFLANTGLRASEFCLLVRSNGLSQFASAVTVQGKGRRRRTVPLNATCREILGRDYIYRPTGRRALYEQIARVARRAKIPPLGPHSLRHYCATQLLLAGVPPAKVAAILGHSIRVLEQTYSHILPADLASVTDVLDARSDRYSHVTEPPNR